MKENKEYTNKKPCCAHVLEDFDIIKMSIPPKAINGFDVSLSKLQWHFLQLENSKIHMKQHAPALKTDIQAKEYKQRVQK